MPKSIEVSPSRFSDTTSLDFPQVPVYAYQTSIAEEHSARGKNSLCTVLRHMMVLREFETMLNAIRSRGEYEGVSCVYRGPAHLSVGQEASAVGLALALTPDDHIFGNHRSHGEALAKGLAAIQHCSDNLLGEKMMQHSALLQATEKCLGGEGKTLAEHFLLFGFLSEILMRATGFNLGMGGSMHAFFTPFGIYPNNAIVGGSAGIAAGAGLFKRQSKDGITVSVTGDGSTGCGQTFEAMNFAAMAQYKTLWNDSDAVGLPTLFYFNNNFYAMGGQTIGETMAWDRLSRIAAGVNAEALHAETVDGTNPLAVADAVSRKRHMLLNGEGPILLDVECYRYSGHSTSDANVYRSREEIKAWQEYDCIERYAGALQSEGVLDSTGLGTMRDEVRELVVNVLKAAANTDNAPLVEPPSMIGGLMFNNTSISLNRQQEADIDLSLCSRVRQNAKKSRSGTDKQGKVLSAMRAITLRDALFESVLHHMLHDDTLIAYGEECREWGGAFGVYRGLSDLFPAHRLFNSPISEATIVSSAVGYSMEGGRALVELMYADFIGRAGDEIFNQMSKWQAMSGGRLQLPVVLRCSVGSKYGAQHSQDWSSLVAHIPGLKVLYPATPYDAKGLLASALSSNDPVVFFESQRLYDVTEQHCEEGVPSEYYQIPMGEPDVKCTGDALTVLTIGPCLYPALEAAKTLANEYNLQTEVIDARALVPFNYDAVVKSVEKTGRIIIVTEACERGSFACTLAANISRYAFSSLKAAPRVLGAPNWIVPGAEMEATYFPQSEDIIALAAQAFYPDSGIVVQSQREFDTQSMTPLGL